MSKDQEAPEKVWVIVPTNWRYNDEYYEEEGSSLPYKAFKTKASASKRCKDMTIAEAKGIDNLIHFSYTYRDRCCGEELKNASWFEERGCSAVSEPHWRDKSLYLSSIKVEEEATQKQILEVLEEMGIVFYGVEEVELA